MKKTLTSLILLALFSAGACAAPTSGDGDGDGDTISGTGGNSIAPGSGGSTIGGVGGSTIGGVGGSTIGGTGGAAGGPADCTGSTFTPLNGFVGNGTMCGYAWTATNTGTGAMLETIDPPCGGGDCFMEADPICATATIPAIAPPNYTGAMIGWNVGQGSSDPAPGTYTTSGAGITVTFSTTGTGEKRLAVKSAGTEYCIANAVSGTPYAWSDFKATCYGPVGAALTVGSPITELMVQVQGTDAAQNGISICLENVVNN